MPNNIVIEDTEDMAIKLYDSLEEIIVFPMKEHLDTKLGIYTREIFIPKGMILIGKKHRGPCVNIIAKGSLVLKETLTDEGRTLTVPENETITFVTQAGVQKIGLTLKDTIFINIFSNVKAKTLESVEEELIIPCEKLNKHIANKEQKCLG